MCLSEQWPTPIAAATSTTSQQDFKGYFISYLYYYIKLCKGHLEAALPYQVGTLVCLPKIVLFTWWSNLDCVNNYFYSPNQTDL